MKPIVALILAGLLSGCAFKIGYSGSEFGGRGDERICYPCFYVGRYTVGVFSNNDSYIGNVHVMEWE